MKVGELRDLIRDLPDEWPVILQRDSEGNGYGPAEGNGYGPAEGAEESLYVAENDWSGEAYFTHEKLAKKIADGIGYWSDEDAAPENAIPCLTIWPTN